MRELICTCRGSVLVNKRPSGFFSTSYGLRQVDPLSPYLFILAEKILNHKVEDLRLEGFILPISQVSSTPCHLIYADDILVFLKGFKRGMRRLHYLLHLYQDSSGQCFNLQKSYLFLGKCSARKASMISGLLQINVIPLPTVYIGVPLFFGSARHRHFTQMLDSMRSWLAG